LLGGAEKRGKLRRRLVGPSLRARIPLGRTADQAMRRGHSHLCSETVELINGVCLSTGGNTIGTFERRRRYAARAARKTDAIAPARRRGFCTSTSTGCQRWWTASAVFPVAGGEVMALVAVRLWQVAGRPLGLLGSWHGAAQCTGANARRRSISSRFRSGERRRCVGSRSRSFLQGRRPASLDPVASRLSDREAYDLHIG